MIGKLLAAVLALFGWLNARAESKRAAAAREAERVEAVRRDAEIRQKVREMAEGEAREKLRTRWDRPAALLTLGVFLSACAGQTPAPVVVDTSCDWVRPILVADADQITDVTARDILAHNEAWAARCRR